MKAKSERHSKFFFMAHKVTFLNYWARLFKTNDVVS